MTIPFVNTLTLHQPRSSATVGERSFALESLPSVPRLTAAQEQQVRDRIIRAAVAVFAEKGYHGATIADVVARSGLSVGAIYTHFTGKDELFLHSCDLISGQGLDELAARLAPLATTDARLERHRLLRREHRRLRWPARPGPRVAWAEAGEEPGVREMLARRRERLLGAAQRCSARASPAASFRLARRRRLRARLHGAPRRVALQRIEAGDAYRPRKSVRRASAVLDVLLAVRGAERPAVATA